MKESDLTDEERKVIKKLQALASNWPEDLWLFANGVHLYVMKRKNGERKMLSSTQGVDPDYVATTLNIPSDGGDW